jgi:hypothetical protein
MRSVEEQNSAGMMLAVCIILAFVVLCVAPKSVRADVSLTEGAGNLDEAMSLKDIPSGKCMWTAIQPPVDRLVYPKHVLVCRTFDVSSITKVKGE